MVGLPGEGPSRPARRLEYVLVHRGGRGQSYLYELLWDGGGTDGRPHLAGLVDPDQLRPYGPDIEHHDGRFEGHRAPIEPRSRPLARGQQRAFTRGDSRSPAAPP